MDDGSFRPIGQPRLTPAERIATIVGLRRRRLTGRAIAEVLRMPRATVSAILRRVGLDQLRVLDPKPVVQRYEWPHAGDLRHLARSKPPTRSAQPERFMYLLPHGRR